MRDNDTQGHPDELSSRLVELQAQIAHERVLLARVKFKRKRLSDRPFDRALLSALAQDIERRLTKLQAELHKITDTSV